MASFSFAFKAFHTVELILSHLKDDVSKAWPTNHLTLSTFLEIIRVTFAVSDLKTIAWGKGRFFVKQLNIIKWVTGNVPEQTLRLVFSKSFPLCLKVYEEWIFVFYVLEI